MLQLRVLLAVSHGKKESKNLIQLLPFKDDQEFNIPDFRNSKELSTAWILQCFEDNKKLMPFIPSKKALTQLPRRFLFSVMFHADRASYDYFMKMYKEEKEKRQHLAMMDYMVRVRKDTIDALNVNAFELFETVAK